MLEEKQAKGLAGIAEEAGGRATGKQPRDDDDGLVAVALDKKRKGLEAAIRDIISEPGLPSFDLEPPLKLPLIMEELFAMDVEDIDFAVVQRQKKEVTLVIHRQEVPMVNSFLIGVKMDAGELT